jgi:hypothetical protein
MCRLSLLIRAMEQQYSKLLSESEHYVDESPGTPPDKVFHENENLIKSPHLICTCSKDQITWRRRCIFGIVGMPALLAALLATISIAQLRSSTTAGGGKALQMTSTDCGSSPEEARTSGCIHNPMLRAWVPPECYFNETQSPDPYLDRVWFFDSNLTKPITDIPGLQAGNYTLIWTQFFHEEHCLWLWKNLVWAVGEKKPLIDSLTYESTHAKHCAASTDEFVKRFLYDPIVFPDLREDMRFRTAVRLEYAKCVPLHMT